MSFIHSDYDARGTVRKGLTNAAIPVQEGLRCSDQEARGADSDTCVWKRTMWPPSSHGRPLAVGLNAYFPLPRAGGGRHNDACSERLSCRSRRRLL
jgi:hypothetical protein